VYSIYYMVSHTNITL